MSSAEHQETLKRIFARAIALRNSGELEEALRELTKYSEVSPADSIGEHVVAGGILWTLGRSGEAAEAMKHVLQFQPLHALASTVLVHCLLDQDRFDQGRAEAARYLRLVASGEAARAPESTKVFFRDVVDASDQELRMMARASREERARARPVARRQTR